VVIAIQKREFFGYIGIFCPFDICIHEEYMTFKPDMHEAPMATGVNAN